MKIFRKGSPWKVCKKVLAKLCKDCILKYEEPKINYGHVILLIAQQNTSVYAMFGSDI